MNVNLCTIPPASITASRDFYTKKGLVQVTLIQDIPAAQGALHSDIHYLNTYIETVNKASNFHTVCLDRGLERTKKLSNGHNKVTYRYSKLYDSVHPSAELSQDWCYPIVNSIRVDLAPLSSL